MRVNGRRMKIGHGYLLNLGFLAAGLRLAVAIPLLKAVRYASPKATATALSGSGRLLHSLLSQAQGC